MTCGRCPSDDIIALSIAVTATVLSPIHSGSPLAFDHKHPRTHYLKTTKHTTVSYITLSSLNPTPSPRSLGRKEEDTGQDCRASVEATASLTFSLVLFLHCNPRSVPGLGPKISDRLRPSSPVYFTDQSSGPAGPIIRAFLCTLRTPIDVQYGVTVTTSLLPHRSLAHSLSRSPPPPCLCSCIRSHGPLRLSRSGRRLARSPDRRTPFCNTHHYFLVHFLP